MRARHNATRDAGSKDEQYVKKKSLPMPTLQALARSVLAHRNGGACDAMMGGDAGATSQRSKVRTGCSSRTQEGVRFSNFSAPASGHPGNRSRTRQVTGSVIAAMAEYMTTSFVQLGAGYEAANKADAVVKERPHSSLRAYRYGKRSSRQSH